MLNKETAKRVIDSLPDDVSMDGIIHALYVNLQFSRGEKEIREGRCIEEKGKKSGSQGLFTGPVIGSLSNQVHPGGRGGATSLMHMQSLKPL
ncbi:MAG TPA: hypothetical protein PLA18_07560 [Deltaproteobacteria bacterium]|jgi:hypothetical protein|nr:hypothetical protein [Deltaproteobacteria bacterium]